MNLRAKFRVNSKTEIDGGFNVELHPVTGGSEENEKFYKDTPYGKLELGLLGEEQAKAFDVGGEYYLDISAAD
jgi:hypothetical protein